MVSFEDEDDPIGSGDESQDEDDNMEDMDEGDVDGDGDNDDGDMDVDGDNEDDNDDNDDDDEDQDDPESPTQAQSQRQRRMSNQSHSQTSDRPPNPTVLLTSPSPRPGTGRSPGLSLAYMPGVRPEALTASVYDIVPTMAAPQSTSINAVAATPDMRWVFSGGADGYIRMYNWVETANGKVPLTVAQKHPFVDSVMKAGSLTTYWENEESSDRTPPNHPGDDSKDLSPVYSLAVQHQAVWLLSGLESGAINLQTCRHQAGTRITTLRGHTSAVSVLKLSQDESSLLSGSWDKTMHDWDMNSGKIKRSFPGSGSQISAIEVRPTSSLSVPEIAEDQPVMERNTFSSNNASKPMLNGTTPNGIHAPLRRNSKNTENGTEDAAGSPDGSLFGDNDDGSLFGDNNDNVNGGGGNGAFGDDDDDEFSKAIAEGLQQADEEDTAANGDTQEADDVQEPVVEDVSMMDLSQGGPVQPKEDDADHPMQDEGTGQMETLESTDFVNGENDAAPVATGTDVAPESTAAPEAVPDVDVADLDASTNNVEKTNGQDSPSGSESTFLDAAIDGMIRIWDRRMSRPVARILPSRNTPPWCMGACWSPDGNSFYAGRRNGTVEEYNLHKGSKMAEPSRTFRFPTGSGAVTAVRSMPNGKHLVCASFDILRLYDLREQEKTKHSTVPFLIVPGHRTGVVSALHIDPACQFMISTAGNRGWEGSSTEVLLGYEINIPGN